VSDAPRPLLSASTPRFSERGERFLTLAARGGLLFDGAMGTQLYERGVFLNQCFEHSNLTQPALVKQVHRDYLEAGAQVLTTNTFGANRLKLARHGLADEVGRLNAEGVRIAREVAGEAALVAASVGPTGFTLSDLSKGSWLPAKEALREHIEAVASAGADVICLETFSVLQELELGVELALGVGLPVVALYTFQPTGLGAEGQRPAAVAQRLVEAGAHVIGSNCGGGPELLYQVTAPMVGLGRPVLAQANAGRPELIEGRSIYVANPEYFSVFARRLLKAGVTLLGGCCGTTPQHVKRMANAVRMVAVTQEAQGGGVEGARVEVVGPPEAPAPRGRLWWDKGRVPLAERSALGARLARGEPVTSVELNPPAGFDLSKRAEAARELAAAGVTTVNIADGPRASLRVCNVAMARHLLDTTPLSPLVHICCRDRSFLGLQSHLLGAHLQGVRNLVVITGDPPKMGPYPHSSGVYDLDSVELLRVLSGYNAGVDPAGKEMPAPTAFVCATGAEPAAVDYDRELRRLELKRDAGAVVVMTQPVYDPRQVERFLSDARGLGVPIMLGLCPLASYRNALFLNENVPGMSVPAPTLERMRAAEERGESEAEGVRIARESLEAARGLVDGVYVMPPFGRHRLALQTLEGYLAPPPPSATPPTPPCPPGCPCGR
jgi:methionine synthase I (cobalamin-dependent)/5,10-methylenetetrahydrofolate reductase